MERTRNYIGWDESASRFSREFRWFFGALPLAWIMKSRAMLAGEGVAV